MFLKLTLYTNYNYSLLSLYIYIYVIAYYFLVTLLIQKSVQILIQCLYRFWIASVPVSKPSLP